MAWYHHNTPYDASKTKDFYTFTQIFFMPTILYTLQSVKSETWKYIVGILLTFVFYIVGQIPLTAVQLYAMSKNPDIGIDDIQKFAENMDFSIFGISSNFGFVLMILMFLSAMFGLFIAIKYIHKRPFIALITPNQSIDVSKIVWAFIIWFIITISFELVLYVIHPDTYIFRYSGVSFFILILISILLLPFQTMWEELVFRSYIMQGIAVWTQKLWIPILVSSVLFGLMHSFNPEIEKYGFWTMQIYYVLAGVFLALITILDNGLELAIGVHTATNFYGATMSTYEGAVLQTDTLIKTTAINPWEMIFGFVIGAVVFYTIARRKFGWPPIQRLFSSAPIEAA